MLAVKMITVLLLIFGITSTKSIHVNEVLCDQRLELIINEGEFKENDTIEYEGLIYTEDNYFYYNYTENENDTSPGLYIGCPCGFNRCYRKCCPEGQILNAKKSVCVKTVVKKSLYVDIYDFEDENVTNLSLKDFMEFQSMTCNSGQVNRINRKNGDYFYVQENGALFYIVENYAFWRPTEEYCIDFVYDEKVEDFFIVALACKEEAAKNTYTIRTTYAALMIIALPFILLTFLIYIFVLELRSTIHGKCIACYTASIFVATLFIIIIYLISIHLPQWLCVTSAFISYTAYMASFFWLNVMSIDAWWTFSGRRGFKRDIYLESKKFKIYSIYAWGSALVALFVALTLQYLNRKMIPSNIIRPQIGISKCWFESLDVQGYYMFIPLLGIIVINSVLFFWTAINVYRIKKETKRTMQEDSGKHAEERSGEFAFYIKLFLAFGVNWAGELVYWLTRIESNLLIAIDIINILYGIFIFILSCCNRKVFNLLKKKIPFLNKLAASIQSSITTTTTDSLPNPDNIKLENLKRDQLENIPNKIQSISSKIRNYFKDKSDSDEE